jgi:hypothetical protein
MRSLSETRHKATVIGCTPTQDGSFLMRVQMGREVVVVSAKHEAREGSSVVVIGDGPRRRVAGI